MKNRFLIFVFFITTLINAQISNLAELATGEMEMFAPLTELDDSIYGYFTIFKLEDVSKEEEKYEYVLLDKNLNKVANGEFIDTKYKNFSSRFLYPQKFGDKIILAKLLLRDALAFSGSGRQFTFSSNRILDLKENKMSEPFYYNNGELVEGNRPTEKIKRQVKKIKTFEYPLVYNDGFFLVERLKESRRNREGIKSLTTYGIDKNKKWDFVFNPDAKRLEYRFELIDDKNIVFWTKDKKTKSQVLHSINPKTGETIFTYELENKESEYNHLFFVEPLKDSFVITGKISPFKSSGYNYEKARGFFKIELDKTGKELSKKYMTWSQIPPEILEIKKNGKIENGYKLNAKEFFVFEDGSISVLTEKSKDSQYYVLVTLASKTTDFLLFNFDKDFNLKGTETIEKEKTKWVSSDYLYSQDVKDGKGVVFFYRDYKKDPESKQKNWILGIVSIIEGKMKHEQIPMSSDDHFIFPYIAKEGYILLRELNKDSDYDQIRLEKLNY